MISMWRLIPGRGNDFVTIDPGMGRGSDFVTTDPG